MRLLLLSFFIGRGRVDSTFLRFRMGIFLGALLVMSIVFVLGRTHNWGLSLSLLLLIWLLISTLLCCSSNSSSVKNTQWYLSSGEGVSRSSTVVVVVVVVFNPDTIVLAFVSVILFSIWRYFALSILTAEDTELFREWSKWKFLYLYTSAFSLKLSVTLRDSELLLLLKEIVLWFFFDCCGDRRVVQQVSFSFVRKSLPFLAVFPPVIFLL